MNDDQSHGAAEWAPLSNFSCFDESPGELRPRNGFAFNTTATDYLNAHVILVFSCIILLKLSDISFLNQLPGPQREGGRLSNRGVGVGFWLVLYTVRVSEREVPTAEYVERKSIFSLVCLANEIHFLPTCTSATARCLFFTPRASCTSLPHHATKD